MKRIKRHKVNSKIAKQRGFRSIPSKSVRKKTRLLGLLVMAILLCSFIIPIPVSAGANTTSVIGTIDAPPVTIIDNGNYYEVNNGQFLFDIFTGTTGYDKILYSDGSVAIYDNRFTLEYLQGSNWKQRGVPISTNYYYNLDGISVFRNYSDYLGTTYTVEYKFVPDKPVKITITINSGQTNSYRLLWSPSGIVANDYTVGTNSLKFDDIIFDWDDAYKTLGDITTYAVSTVAQGKKADAQGKKADFTFNIGIINAGQTKIIDPSIVSTSTVNGSLRRTNQRKSFYAEGRYWVFFHNGTRIVYNSSADGVNWLGNTNDVSVSMGENFALWFDGTYIHEVNTTDGASLRYRRGDPVNDGTITWSAALQNIPDAGSYYVSTICVDNGGHAWIGYRDATGYSMVVRNDNTDGTWSTTAGFPYELSHTAISFAPIVVPLAGETVYAIYDVNDADDKLNGRPYDAGWGAEEANFTATAPSNKNQFSVTSDGNSEIYATWMSGTNVMFDERVGGAWAGNTTIEAGENSQSDPVISWVSGHGDDVTIVYVNRTTDHIYYNHRKSNAWIGEQDWLDESADVLDAYDGIMNMAHVTTSNNVGVFYLTKDANPFDVNFALLALNYIVAPTLHTDAADDITETTVTLNAEITATGGANATVRGFEYDTNSGAPYANDTHTHGDYGIGLYDAGIVGLNPNDTYYFRAYATNTTGTTYGNELNFTTLLPLPLPPTNFIATQTGTNAITLDWTKGTYATSTVIRGKEDGYPISITDGYEVYNGIGITVAITGLNLGTSTYYYGAWSNNATGNSITNANVNIGGSAMMLLVFFGLFLGLIIVNVVVRNTFMPLKLITAMCWAIPFGWIVTSPPSPLDAGTTLNTIVLIITIGAFLISLFAAFRRQLNVSGSWTDQMGNTHKTSQDSNAWHLPTWMKGGESDEKQIDRTRQERIAKRAAYRERFRSGLNGREE